MPLYEYKCNECGHVFEAVQKFSDEPLKECTECSGPVGKLISSSSFHLKGGGWYQSGYADKKPPAPSSGEVDKPAKEPDQFKKAKEAKKPKEPGDKGPESKPPKAPAKESGCDGCPSAS